MQLVEQHLIRKSDPRFAAIDRAAFASKNLYNQANYQIRQAFLHEGKYLPYAEMFHRLKHHEAYCALPRKVSNSILIQLHNNWQAFFKGNEAYREDPSQFVGRPKLPKYKDEESYTSKASFLDQDTIPVYDPKRKEQPRFSGKRETRGLYRAANGRWIHADVNGSYNVLRKAFPDSFEKGTEVPAVVPRRLAV